MDQRNQEKDEPMDLTPTRDDKLSFGLRTVAVDERGFGFVRLNHLAMEHLIGVR